MIRNPAAKMTRMAKTAGQGYLEHPAAKTTKTGKTNKIELRP